MTTLLEQYQNAFTLYQQTLSPSAPKDAINKAFLAFFKCEKLIDSEGIFSKNEDLDDIPTENLQYALCQYYLGKICYALPGLDSRYNHVKKAVKYLETYLKFCSRIGAVKDEELQIFKRGPSFDKRAQNKYKTTLEKEVQAATQKVGLERVKAKSLKGEEKETLDSETESSREYWLLRLKLAAVQAIEELDFASQELPLLEHRQKLEKEKTGKDEKEKPSRPTPRSSSSSSSSSSSTSASTSTISGPPPKKSETFVYQIGGKGPSKGKNPIPNLPLDVAQQLGLLNVSHQQAASAATALKKAPPKPHKHTEPASCCDEPHGIPESKPTVSPLTRGPIDGISDLKAKARETVFRDPNPPSIDLETWADLMQSTGQLPTPETVAESKKKSKKQRAKDRRAAEKSGRRTTVKQVTGGTVTVLSDDDEEDDEEEEEPELTEEQEHQKLKETRAWDNWKDDHERGAGNRKFRK